MSRYYYNLIASMVKADPTDPLWNGLQAYYTADNTPNDALGTYNGTLLNGGTYGTGIINQGFSLDGVNDYVSISPSLGDSFSAPDAAHSYSAWINANSVIGYKWISAVGGSDGRGTAMVISNAELGFFYKGGSLVVTTGVANLSTATWYHVVCAYDGAGTVSFYVNGSFVTSKTASWTQVAGSVYSNVGAHNTGAFFFNGLIDEAGFWNRELTPSEVTELYNAGAAKQYPN